MTCMRFCRSIGVLLATIACGKQQRGKGVQKIVRSGVSNNHYCYALASQVIHSHRRHETASGTFKWLGSASSRRYSTTFRRLWKGRGGSLPSTFAAVAHPLVASASTTTTDVFTNNSPKSLADRAKESLSIAGTSQKHALQNFGGLTYRDSLTERETFRVIFVLGGPGAGKGTQCEALQENYPCIHLSAGQLLREEATKKESSEHASLIEECLVAGKIVPVEISLTLLRNAMKEAEGHSLLFLIDGFPRNFDNLEGWTRIMAANKEDENTSAVWGVLSYNCPLTVLEKRVMERSKDSGRSDDNLESLRRRFKTFQAETVPIIDTLRLVADDTLLNVVNIPGDQSLEMVWEATQKAINNLFANDILSATVRLLQAVARKDVDAYRSLCAEEMFQDVHAVDDQSTPSLSSEKIMASQEGSDEVGDFEPSNIKCAEMTFWTGKRVSLTYDRTLPKSGTSFKETRMWSHQGSKGWRMVHFSRAPI